MVDVSDNLLHSLLRAPVILVAEDEASLRLMIAAALHRDGFDAVLCDDGRDALDQLERGVEVDAVLTDIRMPRMTGVEFVERLRSDNRWRALPVIAMSAYSDEHQEFAVRGVGADAFLAKPFTIADLTIQLRRLLAPKQARPSGPLPHPHS
jgi:CheY-like chemotaxis protein